MKQRGYIPRKRREQNISRGVSGDWQTQETSRHNGVVLQWLILQRHSANDDLNSTSSWNSTSNQVRRKLGRWTQTKKKKKKNKNSPSCWYVWFDQEQRQSSRSQIGSARTVWIYQPNLLPRAELGTIFENIPNFNNAKLLVGVEKARQLLFSSLYETIKCKWIIVKKKKREYVSSKPAL